MTVDGGAWCDGDEPAPNRNFFAALVREYAKSITPPREEMAVLTFRLDVKAEVANFHVSRGGAQHPALTSGIDQNLHRMAQRFDRFLCSSRKWSEAKFRHEQSQLVASHEFRLISKFRMKQRRSTCSTHTKKPARRSPLTRHLFVFPDHRPANTLRASTGCRGPEQHCQERRLFQELSCFPWHWLANALIPAKNETSPKAKSLLPAAPTLTATGLSSASANHCEKLRSRLRSASRCPNPASSGQHLTAPLSDISPADVNAPQYRSPAPRGRGDPDEQISE